MRETEGLSSMHSPTRAFLGLAFPLRVSSALLLTPNGAAARLSRWPLRRSKRGRHSGTKTGPEQSDLDGPAVPAPGPTEPGRLQLLPLGPQTRPGPAPAHASGPTRSKTQASTERRHGLERS